MFDLEEFTEDKFTEIKNHIDNLKVIKPHNNFKKLEEHIFYLCIHLVKKIHSY